MPTCLLLPPSNNPLYINYISKHAFTNWYLHSPLGGLLSWKLLESEEHHTRAYASGTLLHLEAFASR